MENKDIHITTEPEVWECGDGCCVEWYDKVSINGEYIGEVVQDNVYEMIRLVLEHLGFSVEFD